jgi:hypothetical protein
LILAIPQLGAELLNEPLGIAENEALLTLVELNINFTSGDK